MSRKTLRRSIKKQKRKLRRKNQKQRKIMAHLGEPEKTTSDINNVLSGNYNQHQQQQDVVKETNSETSLDESSQNWVFSYQKRQKPVLIKRQCTNIGTLKTEACNHYDIPEDTIRSWYERIRNKLSGDANKRVYHNWNCMLAPKRIELETAKPYLVLAAFFQYYEFDLDKSCVQENCEIFKKFCEDGMIEDEKMKQTVCYLLGENTTEPIDCDIDNDVAFLQDLDLLILASDKDVYKNYAELSRQEWSSYGKTNFDILRRKTLTTLLALDIYQTPEFSKKYAKAARANIEQELKELENC